MLLFSRLQARSLIADMGPNWDVAYVFHLQNAWDGPGLYALSLVLSEFGQGTRGTLLRLCNENHPVTECEAKGHRLRILSDGYKFHPKGTHVRAYRNVPVSCFNAAEAREIICHLPDGWDGAGFYRLQLPSFTCSMNLNGSLMRIDHDQNSAVVKGDYARVHTNLAVAHMNREQALQLCRFFELVDFENLSTIAVVHKTAEGPLDPGLYALVLEGENWMSLGLL